jgi:hypothetical protein
MANFPFPRSSDSASGPDLGSEQDPEFTQDGAPGGRSLGDDLPSVAVPGGQPFILTGYSPQSDQDSLPAPGSTDGNGKAPEGNRR